MRYFPEAFDSWWLFKLKIDGFYIFSFSCYERLRLGKTRNLSERNFYVRFIAGTSSSDKFARTRLRIMACRCGQRPAVGLSDVLTWSAMMHQLWRPATVDYYAVD